MADATDYSAHAFHASLPKGRASGTLRLYEHGLVFTTGGVPAQTVTLPLQGLELKLGGASNRLIFCTHPAVPGWQLYTADHALLGAPVLAAHPARAALGSAKRRHHALAWGAIFGGLAAMVLAGLLVWWSLDALSATAARRLPVEWEEKLGKSVVAQYKLGKDFMEDKEAKALLDPLTAPLAKALPEQKYTLRFHVVNDPTLNAFALPGGYVVIHSGLILKAKHAGELQGVLGHEIAHVTEQHGMRAVIRTSGLYILAQALIGDASGLMAVLADAGPLLMQQKYSRDFERAADAVGYDLLKRASIDPRGMADFFRAVLAEEKRMMEKVEDENARRAMDAARAFLGTHPETPERIATLEKKLKKEPATGWRDDQAAFLALQARVQRFVTENATEKAPAGKPDTTDKKEPGAQP
ncbi:MAG: peptidase [Moraxellaceae bacterium]|jgi:predicted Zn-dependent protease|nr:peptidase [Moraxellaceae bacterium]